MRYFFISLLISFSLIASVNFNIDPASIFDKGNLDNREMESQAASIWLNGKSFAIKNQFINEFDERYFRSLFLGKSDLKPSSVTFGSSRVRYFNRSILDDSESFIDAVHAASLEDLAVFYHLRKSKNTLPEKLYIAIDPWMLDKNNEYIIHTEKGMGFDFLNAAITYSLPLPELSSRTLEKLKVRYLADLVYKRSIDSISFGDTDTDLGYSQVFKYVFPSNFTGDIQWSSSITSGTYNWSWRLRLNDNVIESGTYMDILEGNINPHEMRLIKVNNLNFKKGDTLYIDMVRSNNDGIPVNSNSSQKYKIKDVSLVTECADASPSFFEKFSICGGWFNKGNLSLLSDKLKVLISPAYFQQSLSSLTSSLNLKTNKRVYSVERCKKTFNYIFCIDGSAPVPLDGDIVKSKVDEIVRSIDDGIIPLKDLDPNSLKLLSKLIDLYRAGGTSVDLLLVPVHPYSYNSWKKNGDARGLVKAESIIKKFSENKGVQLYGSYNPDVVGCNDNEFRDWVHPTDLCVAKVVNLFK